MKTLILLAAMGVCAGSLASVPKNQTTRFEEMGAVMYFEFYEGESKFAGTMDLFHSALDREHNFLYLCFTTADHNVRDTQLGGVWYFSNTRPGFQLKLADEGAYTFKNATQMFGTGKIPDLGSVGLKVDLNKHLENYRDLLKAIPALKLTAAPTGSDPYNIKAYGEGDSGAPDREETDYAYVHHNRVKDERPGIQHYYSNRATNTTVKSSIYDFDGLTFDLTQEGGTRNEGMGLIGDSGGAIFGDDTSKLMGVFTNIDKKYNLDNGYGVKWGVNGYGVRLTDTYIRGLDEACRAWTNNVPEPGTFSLAALVPAALIFRRKRNG